MSKIAAYRDHIQIITYTQPIGKCGIKYSIKYIIEELLVDRKLLEELRERSIYQTTRFTSRAAGYCEQESKWWRYSDARSGNGVTDVDRDGQRRSTLWGKGRMRSIGRNGENSCSKNVRNRSLEGFP